MDRKYEDFYRRLRKRIEAWASSGGARESAWVGYILVAPDLFYLIVKLIGDAEVPAPHKARLVAVAAYFISPIDLIPEALLGPVGYVDDVALAAWTLNLLLNDVDEAVLLRHWAGEQNLLALVREIVRVADQMVGSGLWERLKTML